MSQMTGAPIYMPSEEMQQSPLRVSEFSARLAEVEALQPTLPFPVIGQQRFEILENLGLTQSGGLQTRLQELSPDEFDELIHATFSTARSTLDRLIEQAAEQERATALWGDGVALPRLISQTLFWADHYLASDDLAQELIRHPRIEEAPKLAFALESLVELQPLVEMGVVVLVPEEVLATLTADEVLATTDRDLEDDQLKAWLLNQMETEGPTAREVLFVRPRDSWEEQGAMYFYGHLIGKPDKDGIVNTVSLQDYNPQFDYSSWIDQSRRQTASSYLQQANQKVITAEALGAEVLANSPFEAQLLKRKGRHLIGADALLRAEVPTPVDISATDLAKIASEDEAVAALRFTVRRAFSKARGNGEELTDSASELVEDLEQQAHQLERQLKNDRAWRVAVPAGAGVASLLIGGALAGPVTGAAAAAMGSLGSLAPYVADRRERREQPAFALLLAKQAKQ